MVAILEAHQIFVSASFRESLVVESDLGHLAHAISWVSLPAKSPRRFQFYFNEIRFLSSLIRVEFQHVGRMANGFVYALAKQGVDRSSDLLA